MLKAFDKLTRPLVTAAALGLVLPTLASVVPTSAATVVPAAQPQHARLFPNFSRNVVSPLGAAPAPAAAMRSYSFGALGSSVNYQFTKIDDNNGKNSTELLGISNDGRIGGFFETSFVDNGFKLEPPYGQTNFKNEDVLGAMSTEVTSIDQNHDLGGFWTNATGQTFGFVKWHGVVETFSDPNTNSTNPFTEILGINDNGIAVGVYDDGNGLEHGFEVNVKNGKFADIVPLGSTGDTVEATGINDKNEIVGVIQTSGSNPMLFGFLLKGNATFEFANPKGIETAPFGINDNDEIVGGYLDKHGNIHGFTLTNLKDPHYQTVDDPNSLKSKTILSIVNGVNDKGDVVGYYMSAEGNTHGFLATP